MEKKKPMKTLIVAILGLALLVITIIEAVLSSIKSFILSETTNRIDQKLGIKIIDHLFRLPLEYYDKRSIGELSNRVGILEKWRWIIIGGSIVAGFILHKVIMFAI